jgi:hypothetical protein
MTYRDPVEAPDCPVCESAEHVIRHHNQAQGRFLCLRDMLLFDGTSGEWVRRERPAPPDISDELEQARAALREAKTGG